MRGVPVNKRLIATINTGAKQYVSYVEKSAIIGITGIKRLFFEMYLLFTKSKMKAFDTKEEALAYLVS